MATFNGLLHVQAIKKTKRNQYQPNEVIELYHEVKLKVTFRDEVVNTNAYNFTETTKNLDNNNIVIDANLIDANTNNFPKNSTVSLSGNMKQYINSLFFFIIVSSIQLLFNTIIKTKAKLM